MKMPLSKKVLRRVKNELKQKVFAQSKKMSLNTNAFKHKAMAQSKK